LSFIAVYITFRTVAFAVQNVGLLLSTRMQIIAAVSRPLKF